MIVRVARARIRQQHEGEVFSALRRLAESQPADVDGFSGLTFGRQVLPSGEVELLAVTYWRDIAAIRRVLGPDWAHIGTVPGVEHVLIEDRVDHYEVVASKWEQLRDLHAEATV